MMKVYYGLLTSLLLGVAAQCLAAADVHLTHVDVLVSGTEGYPTFRIPSVAHTADGTQHAFAEGRLTNRSVPGGQHFDGAVIYDHDSATKLGDDVFGNVICDFEIDAPGRKLSWWTGLFGMSKRQCCSFSHKR